MEHESRKRLTGSLWRIGGLLALLAGPLAAREYTKIIVMLGGDEALGAPLASETRMTEVPLGTHPAEMWKQVPFAFAGKHSHSISSGKCTAHIPIPDPNDPLTEPRSWWQTLTRQPTCDPQRSHWGAEIGLGRDLYDRGYRDFRIVKYTRNGGVPDATFEAFMKDLLAFPAFDRASFDHHAFEVVALVYFQKRLPGPGDWNGKDSPVGIYRKLRAALPQTRHLKLFMVTHPGNPNPPQGLRPGLYQLADPGGEGSQEDLENIGIVPTHDLARLSNGSLSAGSLIELGQRLAHQLVLFRTLRPPEARSSLTHDPAKRLVRECFVDEKDQPKSQAGAYRQIDYHYAHGRVTKMVFDGNEDGALKFTYSGENTLDQVYDPATKAPLYLSAAGEYGGANGLPLRLPMLPPEVAVRNGAGRCASSPLSPWLWFAMTRDQRSENSGLTLEPALNLAQSPEDRSLVIAPVSGELAEAEAPFTLSPEPPGPWPPPRLMPLYQSAGSRGSFGNFHTFKLCCACCSHALLYPLTLKLPPILTPVPENNFFDPTLACLPTPVGLRRTYEGDAAAPAYLAAPDTIPAFLARKLEYQQARCPSLQPASRLARQAGAKDSAVIPPQPTHTGLFVPFPMSTAQYLERLTLPPPQARARCETTLGIQYETIASPKLAVGSRRLPVEFKYAGTGPQPFAAKWFEYDEAGRVVRETYLDAADHPAPGPDGWSMKVQLYSAEGLLLQTSYLDCNGRLCYNAEGYAEVIHTYNTHRQLLSTEYFSPQGMLTPHLRLGYAAVAVTYRAGGEQVAEKCYHNANNRPAKQKWGYARVKYHYDKSGRELEAIRFHDAADQPCAHLAGHHGVAYTYGSDRRLESETCIGENGEAMMTAYGYARLAHAYDGGGRLHSTRYLDKNGAPATTMAGYGLYSRSYDGNGNLRAEEFIGGGARPLRPPWVWTRKEYTYNADSRLVEERFFDGSGAPVAVDTGYSRILRGYDPSGHAIGEAYYGPGGKLVLGPGRFAIVKHRHTEGTAGRSRRSETLFCAHGGTEPIATAAGYARITYQYDALNRCQRECYFDTEGAPGAKPVSAVSHTLQYDDFGREMLREYRSPNHVERIGPDGYCARQLGFDNLGRLTTTHYRDCSGADCGIGTHFARMTRDFGSDGLSFQDQYFGSGPHPANSDQGIPGRAFLYLPDGTDGSGPAFVERFQTPESAAPAANRFGFAGRVFQLDEAGRLECEIFIDEAQRPTWNSLGYKGIRFDGSKGVFVRGTTDEVTRPDGNTFAELTRDGALGYSARAPEGFRQRRVSSAGAAVAALSFETPEETHYHPFRDYVCRACGAKRPYQPGGRILGPDRFASEQVYYRKDRDLSSTPMPGFTNIWRVYEDATGVPVMNRWNFARVDLEFDQLGQLIGEAYFDTADQPVVTTGGYSKVEYRYKDGYLTGKSFVADAKAAAARPPDDPQSPPLPAAKLGEKIRGLNRVPTESAPSP